MNSSYDGYVYAIALLLPISASMLVFQSNPYNALVLRGILGAVSALIYTILGAADVALTEALVGAFLSTMLCAIAVRSSLVLRLGVVKSVAIAHALETELDKINLPFEQIEEPPNLQIEEQIEEQIEPLDQTEPQSTQGSISADFEKLINILKNTFSKHYMRVELVSFENEVELDQALIDKEIHATLDNSNHQEDIQSSIYQIKIRLLRLYEIMKAQPSLANVQLIYSPSQSKDLYEISSKKQITTSVD